MTEPACSFVQVEVQCEDPNLMQCGLEKCVAVDGSVEWVSMVRVRSGSRPPSWPQNEVKVLIN